MLVPVEEAHVQYALPNLEVLVGTYEEFNLGFKLTKNSEGVSFACVCFFVLLPQMSFDFLSFRVSVLFPALPTTATVEVFDQMLHANNFWPLVVLMNPFDCLI